MGRGDRRRAPRRTKILPVDVWLRGQRYEGATLDLSVSGGFVQTAANFRIGSLVQLTRPRREEEARLTARVVRRVYPNSNMGSVVGVGLVWLKLDAQDTRALCRFAGELLGVGLDEMDPELVVPTALGVAYFVERRSALCEVPTWDFTDVGSLPARGSCEPQTRGAGPRGARADRFRVNIEVSYIFDRLPYAGRIVGLGEDELTIATLQTVPGAACEVQCKTQLTGQFRDAWVRFHGAVTGRADAVYPSVRSFGVKLTRVHEYGHWGLYTRYLHYLRELSARNSPRHLSLL